MKNTFSSHRTHAAFSSVNSGTIVAPSAS